MYLFDDFDADWRNRHKASIPTEQDLTEPSPYPFWARGASFVAFVTSALMSGVHTMVIVYNSIQPSVIVTEDMRRAVSYGSFISYELGMFMAAFLMTVDATKWLARLLATTIFVTLIAVNFYSVVKVYGTRDLAATGVSVMFAFVPVIAYASGKFYINIGIAERALSKRAKELLRGRLVEIEADVNRDYAGYVERFKEDQKAAELEAEAKAKAAAAALRRAEKRLSKPVKDELHEDFMKQSVKGKPRVKLHEVAREVYEKGDVHLSADEMMSKYGISLGGTTKVREILRGQGLTNGKTHD